MESKKTVSHVLILSSVFVLWAWAAQADVVYFKNGFRTEGEVKADEGGYWINGGFFKKEEIKKIIKEKPEGQEGEKRPWYEGLFGSGKPKADKQKKEAVKKASASQRKNEASKASSAGEVSEPAGKSVEQDPAKAFEKYMKSPFAALEHARQLREQAEERQRQIEAEVERMEQGEY